MKIMIAKYASRIAYLSILVLTSDCQGFSIGRQHKRWMIEPPVSLSSPTAARSRTAVREVFGGDRSTERNGKRLSSGSFLAAQRQESQEQQQEQQQVMSSHKKVVSLVMREGYTELMKMAPGDYVVSDTFTINNAYDFRVKVYPRGGGGGGISGVFGTAYQMLPLLLRKNDDHRASSKNTKVVVYLQFLPRFPEQTVDASFALRLKGQQAMGQPRFDVEWRAGMRFQTATNLNRGVANDFGASLMQTSLLRSFLGVVSAEAEEEVDHNNKSEDAKLVVEVEVQIHDRTPQSSSSSSSGSGPFWEDMRQRGDLRVASVVVPVLKKLSERPAMMARGVYPGVEYRILRMIQDGGDDENDNNDNNNDGVDIFHHQPGAMYELKPIYPLVRALERPWPITVRETDIPSLVSPNAYNTGSAVLSLVTAVIGLAAAFWLSTAVSFFYIPSRSMEPTLQIGDVLLVEKVRMGELHRRDIVLFRPPVALQDIVAANGGRLNPRDLFVKRVAGLPGDSYRVTPRLGTVQINDETVPNQLCSAENGVAKFLPDDDTSSSSSTSSGSGNNKVVPPDNVLVLGDCGNVSVDSRVWGPLPTSNLVGRPLVRIWPMDRMGPVR
jgi:signal peptidase I